MIVLTLTFRNGVFSTKCIRGLRIGVVLLRVGAWTSVAQFMLDIPLSTLEDQLASMQESERVETVKHVRGRWSDLPRFITDEQQNYVFSTVKCLNI
jgi:hypothetical protein